MSTSNEITIVKKPVSCNSIYYRCDNILIRVYCYNRETETQTKVAVWCANGWETLYDYFVEKNGPDGKCSDEMFRLVAKEAFTMLGCCPGDLHD